MLTLGCLHLTMLFWFLLGSNIDIQTKQKLFYHLNFFRLPIPVVPFLKNSHAWKMQLLFSRGFSANCVLLIWALFGSVLMHGFLANFRVMLIKPVLEAPVDTAQAILDRGLIPLVNEGTIGHSWIVTMNASTNPVYRQLAKIAVNPTDIPELVKMIKEDVLDAGTHVYLTDVLRPEEAELGFFHYSREVLEANSPFVGWIVNKRWPLNDELAKHLLLYQQAGSQKDRYRGTAGTKEGLSPIGRFRS